MQHLEVYELENGEMIVNVTNEDVERVTNHLAQRWTWESLQGPEVLAGDEDEEATEWLTLKGAVRSLTAGPTPDPVREFAA